MTRLRLLLLLLALLAVAVLPGPLAAHELRPGFLDIRQQGPQDFSLSFKVPARGDLRLGLYLRLPQDCTEREAPRSENTGSGFLDRLAVTCPDGLAGRDIFIDGLTATYTDVIFRVALADGSVHSGRVTPDRPYFTVAAASAWHDTAGSYFLLGVEHILTGIDHLFFVLALLLLVRDRWMLVKTITAFTLAHSITLALSVFGWAAAPQPPIEAVIALSIAFAAAEVVRKPGAGPSLARRAPWLIAFVFGLLHGFGFGGALKEIGLPQTDVPLAFLAFNLGIEAGQLLFVAAVLAIVATLHRVLARSLPYAREVTAYGIGAFAATWFIERLAAMA